MCAISATLITACGTGAPPQEPNTQPSQAPSVQPPHTQGAEARKVGTTSAKEKPTEEAKPTGSLAGVTVALDPGHNGQNASHPKEINRLVPDGRGGKKACNTTGTATRSNFPEHKFNWEVATRVRSQLEAMGATVVMSRKDDSGVGPCVDKRGTFADSSDFMVSIHANGSTDTSIKGFGVIVAPGKHLKESRVLALDMVAGLKDAGFPINRHGYGADGLNTRTDLAGLNHASVPAILVECGEMRNAKEAALMESSKGQDRYAAAIVAGIVAYAGK